ncbi:ubiquinol-cytochrome c reductase iron-sulfur subunit [Acidovorax delafieldii]|nr:ubiquinol-cytochrome c reductase iron-sulfur subunit [Acidovorax delafieldii]
MALHPATPNGSLPGTDGDPSAERRQLVLLTAATGCVAAAGVAVPLVSSLAPSERARAMGAGVEVDISDLQPGGVKTVEWRGKPVWIMRRTPEMLAALPQQDAALADPASRKDQQPEYARNPQRSIRPEVFVSVGICTHLGCSPTAVPAGTSNPSVGDQWQGGFLLPLPRLHLRPGRPRLQEQARAHQPGGAAAPLRV